MRKIISLLLVLMLALGLAACGNQAEEPSEESNAPAAESDAPSAEETPEAADDGTIVTDDEPITLRVAMMPFGHSVPIYYAMINGMFEEANITVESQYFSGGAAQNEAAAAGEWDVGSNGGMPIITGSLAYGYKVIAYGNDDMAPNAVYARPDSDVVAAGQGQIESAPEMYGDAEAWRGKTVLCNTGTSLQYGLDACLALMGLTEADVEVVQMDAANALAAFQAGEGDLCALWDPQRYTAEDEGYIKVASLDMTDEILPTCVTASADMIENHPDWVLRFLKVYLEAQEILSNDLDLYAETFDAWEDECGTPIDEDDAYVEGEDGSTYMDEILMGVAEFLFDTGRVEQSDLDYIAENPIVDSSFIKQAYAELHPEG